MHATKQSKQSKKGLELTRRDKLRFLRVYFSVLKGAQPLRQTLTAERSLLAWLEQKADALYARKQRYGDAL